MVGSITSSHLGTFLLDLLLKGAALLVLAHLASTLLRRWEAPATLRRATWGLAFAALLALPLGQAVLPQSSLPDIIGEGTLLTEEPAEEMEVRRQDSRPEAPQSPSGMGQAASSREQALATGQFCTQANEAVESPESGREVEGSYAFDQPTRPDEQQPAFAR